MPKSFIAKWEGSIKAGIDISKVIVEKDDMEIVIYIPKAEILSHEIISDSIETLDEKDGIDVLLSLCFHAPHHKCAGSEGEDVPVGTQGDGDGGDDAEDFEDYFICFHRGGGFRLDHCRES